MSHEEYTRHLRHTPNKFKVASDAGFDKPAVAKPLKTVDAKNIYLCLNCKNPNCKGTCDKIKRSRTTMVDCKILKEFLDEIRKCNIPVLAKSSGVSYRTIESWLYDGVVPSLVNAQKVAEAMGLEFLLFDKE